MLEQEPFAYQLGSNAGINVYKDREQIYGKPHDFERSRKISDNWHLTVNPYNQRERFNDKPPQEAMCFAESIETWEVYKAGNWAALAKKLGINKSTITKAKSEKSIRCGFFFYIKEQRPSEDEIDAMLDKLEADRERNRELMRANALQGRLGLEC